MRCQLALDLSSIGHVGDELQAVAAQVAPGHGAAQHEGRRLEVFLRGALDVRARGRFGDLLVVGQAAADHEVALGLGQGGHAVAEVQPALHQHEAAAGALAPSASAAAQASSPVGFSVPSL
jgi:hypothetical protein